MARIAISLCGEGRGHATRVSTLVHRLEERHELLVWTSADALEFLRRRFAHGHPRVRIEQVPGMVFEYSAGRLDVARSIVVRHGGDFSIEEREADHVRLVIDLRDD